MNLHITGEDKIKRESEKEIRTGHLPLRGSWIRGKLPLPWEPLLPAGRPNRMEGKLKILRGFFSNQFEKKKERDLHRLSVLPLCAPQTETHIHQCSWGWVLKVRLWKSYLGKKLGWLCGDSLKGQQAHMWTEPSPDIKVSTTVGGRTKGGAGYSLFLHMCAITVSKTHSPQAPGAGTSGHYSYCHPWSRG